MSATTQLAIETAYRERFPKSAQLADRARKVFPDGVTHDGRYLEPFGVYCSSAHGAIKTTVDDVDIVDYWMGHGSLLLGHCHPAMTAAVQSQVTRGTHYGSSQPAEVEWGEAVQRLVPSAETVRFTSSGTEATLMALRISRIATGRKKVLKFAGHFHGWHDFLAPANDPPYQAEFYQQPGITGGVMDDVVIVAPNDLAALKTAISEHNPACVILEPTGGHWGQVPIRGEFLRQLRDITQTTGTVLIFDEVITGFRVSNGGAQAHYGVTPDLTTLAKILAGGLPGGALAGKRSLMQALAFTNAFGKKMRHPGTYNANPLSAAAGVATLNFIANHDVVKRANTAGATLRTMLNELFARRDANMVAYGEFSMLGVLPNYAGQRPADDSFIPCENNLNQLDALIDRRLTHAFRKALLLGGVDFFGWKAMLSSEHTAEHLDQTVAAFDQAIDLLREDGFIP